MGQHCSIRAHLTKIILIKQRVPVLTYDIHIHSLLAKNQLGRFNDAITTTKQTSNYYELAIKKQKCLLCMLNKYKLQVF